MQEKRSKLFAYIFLIVGVPFASNRDEHFSIYVHPFSTLLSMKYLSSIYGKVDVRFPINDHNKIVASYTYYSFRWQDCQEESFCSFLYSDAIEMMNSYRENKYSLGWQRPFSRDFDFLYYQPEIHIDRFEKIGENARVQSYAYGMSFLTGSQFSIRRFSVFCDFGPKFFWKEIENPEFLFDLNIGMGIHF